MAGRTPLTFSPMRAAIARRMTHSWQGAPHFYVTADLDLDMLVGGVEELNAGRDPSSRISVTAALLKAVALSLVEHPSFNALWQDDHVELVEAVNIGVAIALDDGLIAPALLGCERLDVEQIGSGLRDLVARTRSGRVRAAELSEATFTLSNLGMFDVRQFAAIVVPPQVAILATGRIEPRAVVRDGTIIARQMMSATLSADHRVVDGAGAARFLETLKDVLGRPQEWLAAQPAG